MILMEKILFFVILTEILFLSKKQMEFYMDGEIINNLNLGWKMELNILLLQLI